MEHPNEAATASHKPVLLVADENEELCKSLTSWLGQLVHLVQYLIRTNGPRRRPALSSSGTTPIRQIVCTARPSASHTKFTAPHVRQYQGNHASGRAHFSFSVPQ